MLQAHALVPEGAGGGSIYKRPKGGAATAADPSYTLPAYTPLPPAAAAAAAATAAAAAAGQGPVSGSDMELVTAGDEIVPAHQAHQVQEQPAVQQHDQSVQAELEPEPVVELHPPAQQAQAQRRRSLQPVSVQQQQQQQQQQPARRQSLQPVAGRVAHAAAAAAPRPASAESQVQQGVAAPAAQQRRQSMAPGGAGAAAAAAAAGGSRRVSAPPAPIDRELHFSSVSTLGGAGMALAAVPEEQPLAEADEAAVAAAAAAPRQQQAHQPAASQATAVAQVGAGAAAAAAADPHATPASVPAPPRELALAKLTGLASTPLKGGIYQFTDPRHGYVFQLGPASPDSAGGRALAAVCSWADAVRCMCGRSVCSWLLGGVHGACAPGADLALTHHYPPAACRPAGRGRQRGPGAVLPPHRAGHRGAAAARVPQGGDQVCRGAGGRLRWPGRARQAVTCEDRRLAGGGAPVPVGIAWQNGFLAACASRPTNAVRCSPGPPLPLPASCSAPTSSAR